MSEPSGDSLARDPASHGLWAHSAPPLPADGALAGEQKADVVVLGAGFTGLAAALRLAENGASVVVLEAREVGWGASGRNVGLVNAGLWLSPREIVERLGSDYGERLMNLLGEAPSRVFDLIERHDIQCEVNRAGTLHCAHSRSGYRDLQQRAESWMARGAPVTLLDRHEAGGKIGSEYFHGALLDHRAGTLQPLGYVRGLALAASRAGVRIHTRSEALSLSQHHGDWRVATRAGSVAARSVIIATNAYTEAVAPIIECIVPFSFFQLSTPPLPARVRDRILPEGQGAWDTAKVLTSFRMDKDGRLIVGSIGRLDPGHQGIHACWMRRKVRRMFPQLEGISFDHGWYGTIATTRDHLPRLSRPYDNVLVAYGYNGRGIGTGTVFGRVLADYLLSDATDDLPLPLTPMKPVPMRALRTSCIELGVKAWHFVSDRF